MAIDLLYGRTKRSWARGTPVLEEPVSSPSDEVTLRLTVAEMDMLAKMAATKALADSGDRSAKKQMSAVVRRVAGLKKQAAKGDEKARRTLLVLRESGVFRGTTTFAMGADAVVPNTTYRAVVLSQAVKAAGGKKPTTKHFYAAKKAVDRAMGAAGIGLFLPGSRPGRVTSGAMTPMQRQYAHLEQYQQRRRR